MDDLPESLWHDSQVVMAELLAVALRDELKSRGLFEKTCGPNPKDAELIGGEASEDAIKHFTYRFSTSAARVQYVVLSPYGLFESMSNDLLAFILDGKVSILDIPCGSGGGLLSFLCTVADLRKHGRVPSTPVEVTVFAGDISPEARQIHEAMLKRVSSGLAEVGIRTQWHHVEWNVKDQFSTSRLIDLWFSTCPNDEEYLVFVSAFGGFAKKNIDIVLKTVESIIFRFHSKVCLLTWIEPIMNDSTTLLKKLTGMIKSVFKLYMHSRSPDTQKDFHFRHPFTGNSIPSRVQVRSFHQSGPSDA